MKFILNIGLDADATPEVAAAIAIEIIKANEFLVGQTTIVGHTLVARVEYRGVNPMPCLQFLRAIATDLNRDCIAVYRPLTGKGALVGPRPEAYGRFERQAFVMPSGKTLKNAADFA